MNEVKKDKFFFFIVGLICGLGATFSISSIVLAERHRQSGTELAVYRERLDILSRDYKELADRNDSITRELARRAEIDQLVVESARSITEELNGLSDQTGTTLNTIRNTIKILGRVKEAARVLESRINSYRNSGDS